MVGISSEVVFYFRLKYILEYLPAAQRSKNEKLRTIMLGADNNELPQLL